MDRITGIQRKVRKIFNSLRPDVKKYFEKHRMIPEIYNPEIYGEINSRDVLNEYHSRKKDISKLCGWDSIRGGNDGKYNQKLFDRAMEYLIEVMGI